MIFIITLFALWCACQGKRIWEIVSMGSGEDDDVVCLWMFVVDAGLWFLCVVTLIVSHGGYWL